MDLTVGKLKKILSDLDDNIILADMEYFNDQFHPFIGIKRLLVLKDESENKTWGGHTFLTINNQGSHFTGEGEQKHLKYTGVYFDEKTLHEL